MHMSRLRAELSEHQAARAELNSRLRLLRAEVDRQQAVIAELKLEALNQRSRAAAESAKGPKKVDSADVGRLKEELKQARRELAIQQEQQEVAVGEVTAQHADAVRKCERYSATISRQQKLIVNVFTSLSQALGEDVPSPDAGGMPLIMTATAGMVPLLHKAVAAISSMPTSPVPPQSASMAIESLDRQLGDAKAALAAMEEERDGLKARLASNDQEQSEKMARMHNTLLAVQKKALGSKAQLKVLKTTADGHAGQIQVLEAEKRAMALQIEQQEQDLHEAAQHLQEQLRLVESLQQERDALYHSHEGLGARAAGLQEELDEALASNTRLQLSVAESGTDDSITTARSAVKKAELEADLKEEEVRQLRTALAAAHADLETTRAALMSSHQAVKAAEADAEAYETQLNDLRWRALLDAKDGKAAPGSTALSPPPRPASSASTGIGIHIGSNMHRPSSKLRAALEARARDVSPLAVSGGGGSGGRGMGNGAAGAAAPPSPGDGMRAAVLGQSHSPHKGDTKTLAMVQAALRLKKKQGTLYK